MTSRLRSPALTSYRTIGTGSVGAIFLGAMFGVGRCGVIEKTSLISVTSEERGGVKRSRLVSPGPCRPRCDSSVRTRLAAGGGSQLRTRLCFSKFPASWEKTGNFGRF